VIANNSGVAHLAVACGTPTLAIYSGSHQPQEWGPRGNNVRAVMALVPLLLGRTDCRIVLVGSGVQHGRALCIQAIYSRNVISPVSNSELRDWGIANYARLVALLLGRTDCRIVLVGSGVQHRQLERILEENGRDPRIINLAGARDWFGTAEIIRAAELVFANNSGGRPSRGGLRHADPRDLLGQSPAAGMGAARQ
jgi:ADP-heptose:LPS heptosyltransferase